METNKIKMIFNKFVRLKAVGLVDKNDVERIH